MGMLSANDRSIDRTIDTRDSKLSAHTNNDFLDYPLNAPLLRKMPPKIKDFAARSSRKMELK